jgi:CrcB protein
MTYIAVLFGGALGTLLRFLINPVGSSFFPFTGTFLANTIGSLLVGFFYWRLPSGDLRLLIITGVLGGFTTLSSLSAETLDLVKRGQVFQGALYLIVTCVVSLFCTYLGFLLGIALDS